MNQVSTNQQLLLPSQVLSLAPAHVLGREIFYTDDDKQSGGENNGLWHSQSASVSMADQIQEHLLEDGIEVAGDDQRFRKATEQCEFTVSAQQQLVLKLAQCEDELQNSVILLTQTQSDLQDTKRELRRLQTEHTHLLSITRQSVSISTCGMPSTIELLLELDHQHTQNRLLERMFAQWWNDNQFHRSCQTLNYLSMWHGRIRDQLGLTRVAAESWRCDGDQVPDMVEAGLKPMSLQNQT